MIISFSRKPARLALLAPGPPCEQGEAGVVAGAGRKARKGNSRIRICLNSLVALELSRETILDLFIQAVANSHPYILSSPEGVKYFIKSFN